MRKKEKWMKRGAEVLALGKLGKISSMQKNTIDSIDYVYYINVKLIGQLSSEPYHPNDIKQI